jgi:hypothetical protein
LSVVVVSEAVAAGAVLPLAGAFWASATLVDTNTIAAPAIAI